MGPFVSLLIVWACIAVLMTIFYAIQLKTKNATTVDAVWAVGLAASAVFYALTGTGDAGRRLLLAVLAGIWGLRLAVYLAVRAAGGPEDGRYAHLRSKWGDSAAVNFFFLYQAQASWVVLFSIPFLLVSRNPQTVFAWNDFAAIAMWVVAIGGEAVADGQLHRFRRDPHHKGTTCRKGLWKYSRHPNYFFEWLHWFTYVFLAVGSAWWWIGFSGPVVMLLFLYKVTGIPYTEKRALETRGEDYRRYQQTTSAFIPRPPRKTAHETNH